LIDASGLSCATFREISASAQAVNHLGSVFEPS